MFRLDRIREIELLTSWISQHESLHFASFSNKNSFLLSMEIQKKLYHIIKDDAPMSHIIKLTEEENSYILQLETSDTEYFSQLAFQNADAVTLFSPEFLVDLVSQRATLCMEKYNRKKDSDFFS